MEKRKFGIFMAEERVDAVPYDGPRHARRYMRKLAAHMPLDTDKLEKLTDFARHRAALTRFCIDVVDGAVTFDSDSLMTLNDVTNYVWQCYTIAHRRATLLCGHGVEEAVRGMWALFAFVFEHTRADVTRAALATSCADFDFAKYAEAHSSQICVSDAPVGQLSVHMHWQTATALIPMLYEFAYSPAMHAYVQALVMRHAQFLNGVPSAPTHGDDDDAPVVYDDPLYCDRTVGRPFYADPDHPECFLNDVYLADAEVLFGPQLTRINRVRWLSARAVADRVKYDLSSPATAPTQAMATFVESMSRNDVLRRFVVDPMREQVLRTHLMHGERTRFMRLHPKQEPEPDNVLASLRHNDYSETPALIAMPLGDIARAYAAGVEEVRAIAEWAARPRVTYEREFLLGCTIAMGTWMTYQGAPADFVTKRIHLEEVHVGYDELASSFLLPEQRPALVRCMRWHFVIDVHETVVYAGLNPMAALGAWLQAVHDETIARLKLDPSVLHDLLRSLLRADSRSPSVANTPAAADSATSASLGTGVSLVQL